MNECARVGLRFLCVCAAILQVTANSWYTKRRGRAVILPCSADGQEADNDWFRPHTHTQLRAVKLYIDVEMQLQNSWWKYMKMARAPRYF
jgi:hypothetical protein